MLFSKVAFTFCPEIFRSICCLIKKNKKAGSFKILLNPQTTYWTISFCGLLALFLACFSSQLESFSHLFGSQEKLFFTLSQNGHLEQGMLASLFIFCRSYVTFGSWFMTYELSLMANHNDYRYMRTCDWQSNVFQTARSTAFRLHLGACCVCLNEYVT